GALGVPVMFDVFPTRVVMKHEAGGAYLSAVFRVDGDRMLGTLRGHDTLILLSRDRGSASVRASRPLASRAPLSPRLSEPLPPRRPRGARRARLRRPRPRRFCGSPDP